MDTENLTKLGSESQDSDEPVAPGTSKLITDKVATNIPIPLPTNPSSPATPIGFKLKPSTKGVENAKKRLRAFSIQKKTPITPVTVTKSAVSGTSNTTVFIGKLSGVKVIPKTDDVEQKKLPPKPPKPGQNKKTMQDSYTELQKRTLSEIEDMKRKMELVELGIPLGLICPTSTNEKAMPTKAMPPIKSFLDPAKLDEIITEAKKAKAEGREFKFDYQKLLPDYDNPFQRKKDEFDPIKKTDPDYYKKSDKDKRKSDRYDRDRDRRHSSHRKDDRDKRRDDRDKHRDKSKEKDEKKEHIKKETKKSVEKETDVNLSDYLVCDSWSLDNEDKTNSSSPKRHEAAKTEDVKTAVLKEKPKEPEPKPVTKSKEIPLESPKTTPIRKMEKLQPVIDSFKYEIDPNEDEILDIFDENSGLEKYAKVTHKKDGYDSPYEKIFDFDQTSKDASNDALTEDTFLESVINEIKQEGMTDEEASHDKGLVEYDSPRESSSPKDTRISVTPELDDRMRDLQSSRSDYSDGYRSTESGYKSTESGYKSNASYRSDNRSESYRVSVEKEVKDKMTKCTVDSLETWSFVLKICQPLLFRHDRNKCYRESRTLPKIWYTENPKLCTCVKDRAIVYEELETCKMSLVDRVYGCDQIQESEFPKARAWYPRFAQCLTESSTVPTVATSSEWEADDSQTETPVAKDKANALRNVRSTTPLRNEEIYLDREYQRFMEAVWPEVSDTKAGTPRSTTPVKQDARKKKAEDTPQEDKKKAKKIKLSSEGWSQESDIEEEEEKTKKMDKMQKADKAKLRKRKHSSSSISDSDDDSKKRRKLSRKKANKKTKSKLTKRQRLSKKYLKKLKEKQKKKKKQDSEDEDAEKENRKKEKKLRKKKLLKKKKAQKKKKAKAKSSSSSSSSSSSTESSSDSEIEDTRKKKKKKSDVKKKKRKQSSSESTQSEDLFDVNVLNNIKTERLTDDEKKLEFSPRRQKPREIINVKELQNDFVGSVQVKKEVEDNVTVEKEKIREVEQEIQREEKEFVTEKVPETVSDIVSESVSLSIPESVTESVSLSIPESVTGSANDSVIENDTNNTSQTLLEDIPVPKDDIEFKEPYDVNRSTPQDRPEVTQPEESNLSQCSSQESTTSKDPYEKDDSHLRPSSQNSNYSFNDVINASQNYQKEEDDKFEQESYEQGNYEMYEQLAMAYQSDVAKQVNVQSPGVPGVAASEWWGSQRIETVVRARPRGEIKCDWRAGDRAAPATQPASAAHRPSRWGLKPGDVNIVLTGGNTDQYPIPNVVEPVYQIQSIANNRAENNSTGSYDEAYEDMYGASDRLQYGDCFATDVSGADIPLPPTESKKSATSTSSLDDRINQALRTAVLSEISRSTEETEADKDGPEKGILLTKSEPRGGKRVSFADGYKPGQDSDVEEPPKRKKKVRRFGCAWPCPATHPDHVPLWDALPPPPPPPGSPPPMLGQQPANMLPQSMLLQQPPPMMQQQQIMQQQQLLQQQGINPAMLQAPPFAMGQKMDPSASLPNFMPPEPPPGLITFQ